ncbi:MAG: hypothetical protein V4619_19175 [Bacteroidota bacterium]
MEKKLLQRQLVESSIYFADESRKSRLTKVNVLLALVIVFLSLSIRLTERSSVTEVNDSTTQQYLDIQSRQVISKFNRSQIA